MQATMITKRFFFATVLSAIAACLITNAHYSGVYPVEMMASGGLLGDVIFFFRGMESACGDAICRRSLLQSCTCSLAFIPQVNTICSGGSCILQPIIL